MQKHFRRLLVFFVAVLISLLCSAVSIAEDSRYTVGDLLHPCAEGDNDARGGAVFELECEQYLSGFIDLYLRAGMDLEQGVCLPNTRNFIDEIRWSFMRWAHENFDQRYLSAVDGLISTLNERFPCRE